MHYSITEFEAVYRRCFPSLLRVAVSMLHDADEARDAVQEVFLKLWEKNSDIDNELAYLIRAVRNTCLDRIAAKDTRERLKQRLPVDEVDEADDRAISSEYLNLALESLLTPRERQVVEKVYSEGLSYKDTATHLGVSVAMVNKSIVGALKKLRKHFK